MVESKKRVLRLRYPAKCAVCLKALDPGTRAEWNSTRKMAICLPCTKARPGRSAARSSVAGASARAEASRRRAKQQARLHAERERRPILGRVRQSLFPEADAGWEWEKGAVGEEQLASSFGPLVEAGTIEALHDRRVPGSRANIDHIVIAASGVWIVDSKRYAGRIKKDLRGGWLNARTVVTVGGRDRTKLVDGMAKQEAAVRSALASVELSHVDVHTALCFIDGDWGFRFRPFTIDGVLIAWPKALRDRFTTEGPLDAPARAAVADALSSALPPAG